MSEPLLKPCQRWPLPVFAILSLVLYLHTLNYDFVFDDSQNVRDNPNIRITSFDPAQLRSAAFDAPSHRRPVANLSFALNYLADGYNPRGYRLVNVVIHIVNAGLVYWLLCLILQLEAAGKEAKFKIAPAGIPLVAAATTAIWAVHPLQVQAVAYIVQRMTSLASMFILLALCLYIVGRKAGITRRRGITCIAAAALCWLISLGCKEIAVAVPLLVFFIEWYFFQNLKLQWPLKTVGLWIVPMVVVVVVLVSLLYLDMKPVEHILKAYENMRDFTPFERVLTQFRVLVFYLTLIVLPIPSRLTLDHHFPPSTTLLDPLTTALSLALLIGILVVGVMVAKRHRLLSFCIFWYFIGLALESSIIGLEMAYEHRLYLPCLMPILALVLLVRRALCRRNLIAPAVIIVVLLMSATIYRTLVWRDGYTLWQDCARKAPNKPRPLTNFGYALVQRGEAGDIDEAVRYYHRALAANPNYPLANNNLAKILTDRGDYAAAIEHCQRAINKKPKYAEAYNNYGVALVKSGNYDDALEKFHTSIKLDPNNASVYRNIGNAHLSGGDLDQADQYYQHALTLQPDSADVWNGRGGVQKKRGRHQDALPLFRKALALDPTHKPSRANCRDTIAILGSIELKAGRIKAAAAYFSEAIDILPNAKDCNNLGACLGQLGQLDDAIAMFARAVELDPEYGDAHRNLEAAEQMKQPQEHP